MNLKKIISQHKRQVPHPFAYMGIVEGPGNKTSVVIESDNSHPLRREDILMLLATLMRVGWRVSNDTLVGAGLDQQNMASFMNELYVYVTKHTTDGKMSYDPRGK